MPLLLLGDGVLGVEGVYAEVAEGGAEEVLLGGVLQEVRLQGRGGHLGRGEERRGGRRWRGTRRRGEEGEEGEERGTCSYIWMALV